MAKTKKVNWTEREKIVGLFLKAAEEFKLRLPDMVDTVTYVEDHRAEIKSIVYFSYTTLRVKRTTIEVCQAKSCGRLLGCREFNSVKPGLIQNIDHINYLWGNGFRHNYTKILKAIARICNSASQFEAWLNASLRFVMEKQ